MKQFLSKMQVFLFSHDERVKGADFKNNNCFFSNRSLKIPKYDIFCENLKVFFLRETLCELNFTLRLHNKKHKNIKPSHNR